MSSISWRSPLNAASAAFALAALLLAACNGEQIQSAAGSPGELYAKGLDEISEVYIEPVAVRQVALSGAAGLSRLDNRLIVSNGFGAGFGGALSLNYEGRDIAMYPLPGDKDTRQWGETVAQMIATAKQASPRIAAEPQEAVDKAVFDGMTGTLDHFSRYLTPEVARDQRATRDGYGGVGITFDSTNDQFRVTALAPDGPAERGGIKIDDRLLAIDGLPTAGRAHEEVVHQLRGPVGSPLSVSVLHQGTAQPRTVQLHRGFVIAPSVTMTRDGNIAVIRVTSFNHSTTEKVSETLREAQRQSGGKLAGIVLDLRSNPGGLLDQAVSMADLFIDKGPIIATVGRHPAARQYFGASGHSIAAQTPIVVLINGGSASSAEIVAAALQDAGRAVVIGSSSYGKGTVQTVIRMPNGGDLIVTWARIVSPSGYLLQQHGVVPTVCTAGLTDDAQAVDTGLQRAGSTRVSGPRAGLDEAAWAELRRACPSLQTRPAVDLKLAQRVLSDGKLYSEALHALLPAPRVAQGAPAQSEPVAALTDAPRTLFSVSR